MKPKERIVNQALKLFNAKGIEYVGMRELAASLDLKLGNITYYFPTKEDLVYQISLDLTEANSGILHQDESISISSFLRMSHLHFECQYRYRCLFLSFVHIVKQYKAFSGRYKKIEAMRKQTARTNIDNLIRNKYLRNLSETEIEFLLSAISLVSRFWISEAAITNEKMRPAPLVTHYNQLLAQLLLPYCTAAGKKDLQPDKLKKLS